MTHAFVLPHFGAVLATNRSHVLLDQPAILPAHGIIEQPAPNGGAQPLAGPVAHGVYVPDEQSPQPPAADEQHVNAPDAVSTQLPDRHCDVMPVHVLPLVSTHVPDADEHTRSA